MGKVWAVGCVFVLAFSALSQDEVRAGKAADVVLRQRRLSAEDARLVREVLVRMSEDEPTFGGVLAFAALGYLFEDYAKKSNGDLLRALMSDPWDDRWWVLERMGELYYSESHLPSVRYTFADPSFRERVQSADWAYRQSEDAKRVERMYFMERDLGSRPDDAYRLLIDDVNGAGGPEGRRGWWLLQGQLLDLGKDALTGYTKEDANRNVAAYLESRYAHEYTGAKDTKGVRKASSPAEFIGQKAFDALLKDRAHQMRTVDMVIDKALARLNELRGGGAPATGGISEFPTIEQMGQPGRLKDQTGWLRWDGIPAEYGLEVRAVTTGEKNVRKYRKLRDGVSDPHNGHGLRYEISTANDPRHDGYTGYGVPYLKENTEYEVVFFPWLWADTDRSAFVAPGFSVSQPSTSGRTYLPGSDGKMVTVHFRAKTDPAGRLRFVLAVDGRSAFTLGSVWLRPVG